ncbi:MAG: LysM peptidoglycan-binding domain-containing protein [Saprospiraceae bacterium]
MFIRKSLWLLTLTLLAGSHLQAERVFVLFDQTCMDRLEYKQAGQPGSYVVYQVNVAPGERLLLEVGQESGEYRGNMPGPRIGCSTGIFDARMVDNINSGIDEVFVINQLDNGRHTITQVSLAGVYQYNQQTMAFESPKYQFRFDLEHGAIGENIATAPGSQREVFFEGRMEEQCLGAYIFRQFAPRSAKPHLDLVFIPEIGIIEERAGFTLDEALSNAIKLENINGLPLDYRINQMCNQGNFANSGSNGIVLQNYGSEVTPVFSDAPDMSIKGNETTTAPPITSNATTAGQAVQKHSIAGGETLYSISKKYGVTVNDLKKWNNLKSNTIYKGKQLIVSDPSQATTEVSTDDLPRVANIASANPGSSVPVPYENTSLSVKGVNQVYHTVRTGETVASIAMKYGYTEARFREINGLKANEYPKIGQQLKTTDCDCPDVQTPTTNYNDSGLTPKTINPYDQGAYTQTRSINNTNSGTVTGTPSNNYSFSSPSPSSYENTGQTNNTRPFSSYTDIPVPATGTMTAPTAYGNGTYNGNSTLVNSYGGGTPINTRTYPANYDSSNLRASDSSQRKYHYVADGESLYDIARQYGTTVQRLQQLNRLDPNEVVIPNQKIYLE